MNDDWDCVPMGHERRQCIGRCAWRQLSRSGPPLGRPRRSAVARSCMRAKAEVAEDGGAAAGARTGGVIHVHSGDRRRRHAACWRLSVRLAPVALGSTAGWISSCADSEKTCLSLAISRRDIRTVHTIVSVPMRNQCPTLRAPRARCRTLALTFYGFMHRFDPASHRIAC